MTTGDGAPATAAYVVSIADDYDTCNKSQPFVGITRSCWPCEALTALTSAAPQHLQPPPLQLLPAARAQHCLTGCRRSCCGSSPCCCCLCCRRRCGFCHAAAATCSCSCCDACLYFYSCCGSCFCSCCASCFSGRAWWCRVSEVSHRKQQQQQCHCQLTVSRNAEAGHICFVVRPGRRTPQQPHANTAT